MCVCVCVCVCVLSRYLKITFFHKLPDTIPAFI